MSEETAKTLLLVFFASMLGFISAQSFRANRELDLVQQKLDRIETLIVNEGTQQSSLSTPISQ